MTNSPAMDENDSALIDPVEILRAVYEIGYQLDSPMPSSAVIGEFLPSLTDAAETGRYSYHVDYHTGGRVISIQVSVDLSYEHD